MTSDSDISEVHACDCTVAANPADDGINWATGAYDPGMPSEVSLPKPQEEEKPFKVLSELVLPAWATWKLLCLRRRDARRSLLMILMLRFATPRLAVNEGSEI